MKRRLIPILIFILLVSIFSTGCNADNSANGQNDGGNKEENVLQGDTSVSSDNNANNNVNNDVNNDVEHNANNNANSLTDEELEKVKAIFNMPLPLVSTAYYLSNNIEKRPLALNPEIFGEPFNEKLAYRVGSEKIIFDGVCLELSGDLYDGYGDFTINMALIELDDRILVKVSDEISSDNIEFLYEDMEMYLYLYALSENTEDYVSCMDFDDDAFLESYVCYSVDNKRQMIIYDYYDDAIHITSPAMLWGEMTGSSPCIDAANIKPTYRNCIFVFSDDEDIDGIYSYHDGQLTKKCEKDEKAYVFYEDDSVK